ncbi:putative polyketide cyclase (plasmid) [Gordonia polyisoprenivorans VH2]|uniref:SRPBCC family protein n=2 Tax=Gordonia polyisoprenivorans TaxID=84595 RepID=A0A846WRL0_9ACTN|nr:MULTISPECIES: SRPBCC family protein [Gordonia]AFA76155.1 putative polyketide cyclase [Gordonia polyisoprenivorans VH2]MDF3283263.1 SRPBCC family protein [Gordonia sp. N1V]NKY04185.1 SRPBCC family protein [Gordonia polyisoprenivorans]OPX15172.1 polyketide cyclase / dehydrase and lipid transport [Gordonia sp. i37]OZC30669.1 SRPBCC family protein [Gordonia polyisoprenivorans]
MADVDVEIDSDLAPQAAWDLASDLSRFPEWMTIFGGWRSDVPTDIGEGTEVSSVIRVKGFRNIIHWQVTDYDAPRVIALRGHGRGGVRITLTMTVSGSADGSRFALNAELAGGVLGGPIGRFVAKIVESDVKKSIENLATLV